MAQRKSGHVTLTDVAKACGFSVSTVSLVLSEAPLSKHVAKKTKQQIRAKAQQLGYHPDAYARSLQRRRSQTIGVLAYDLSDPYCIPIVRGIQEALQPAGYLPLLMDAQTRRGLFDRFLEMTLERRAEGVVVIANWVFDEENLLSDVKKNNVPIVIVSRDLTGFRVHSVLVDNELGGALALRHLHVLGHRQIAFVTGPEEMFDSAPRWAGIQKEAAEAGIPIDPRLVLQLPNQTESASGFDGGLKCVQTFLNSGLPFTAVVAFDDLTALGVVRGLIEAGRQVPQDCSVIGFDDVLPAAVATPGITTIHQPLSEMGLIAGQRMVDAIEAREHKHPLEPTLYRAVPSLVLRTSTAPLPATMRNNGAAARSKENGQAGRNGQGTAGKMRPRPKIHTAG